MTAPYPSSPRPDWLRVLADACRHSSQAAMARLLGISQSTVSQLLKGTYKADTTHMEARVRGELMRGTVPCPVLGELGIHKCLEEQMKPYYPNPLRSALFKACKTCIHAHRADAGAPSKEKK